MKLNTSRARRGAVILLSLAVGLPQFALAKPKSGSGGSAKCACMCVAPSGFNGGSLVKVQNYDSKGYACSAFEGVTCNMDNPYTGGVSTGSLIGCEDAKSSSSTIVVLPFGGLRLAPKMRR